MCWVRGSDWTENQSMGGKEAEASRLFLVAPISSRPLFLPLCEGLVWTLRSFLLKPG